VKTYDVIIIGAGSVGVPAALFCAQKKLKALTLDYEFGPGQQNNKKAIGGVRATHSDYGKIKLCQRSIDIFSTWKDRFGDDIGWMSNGYSFPAYTKEDENKLKELMKIQHSFGLNIKWISAEEYNELVPGIEMENLRGATYSPQDGSCSPLLAISSMFFRSIQLGAEYKFREKVVDVINNTDSLTVQTDKNAYEAKYVINCAGNHAKKMGEKIGITLPVQPDNHEAGITEPVKRFMEPMVVDMRKRPGSANFYFYQNNEGQVVFCITPEPPIIGIDNRSTSEFLPLCAKRMLEVYPRLRNVKVRRTWRGQYPMTPDGFPIIGTTKEFPNFINAVGMCGQGFMLGPGAGELISRIITESSTKDDEKILKSFDFYRDFSGMEAFK
jgi:sarcosine oxidase, subunit beta